MTRIGKKAVIFDRDGTLIYDKIYLNDPKQIEYLPGVFEALRILRDLGYVFVIATNQSGIASRVVDIKNLDLIHLRISEDFAKHGIYFRGFYYAPYSTLSFHPRRKPNAGMLLDAARDHTLDLKSSWMIGDRMTDVEAGHLAGCRTVLLTGTEAPQQSQYRSPEALVHNLLEAASFIQGS